MKVSDWLEKISMTQYTHKLQDANYENLEDCAGLTKDDLVALGIKSVHARTMISSLHSTLGIIVDKVAVLRDFAQRLPKSRAGSLMIRSGDEHKPEKKEQSPKLQRWMMKGRNIAVVTGEMASPHSHEATDKMVSILKEGDSCGSDSVGVSSQQKTVGITTSKSAGFGTFEKHSDLTGSSIGSLERDGQSLPAIVKHATGQESASALTEGSMSATTAYYYSGEQSRKLTTNEKTPTTVHQNTDVLSITEPVKSNSSPMTEKKNKISSDSSSGSEDADSKHQRAQVGASKRNSIEHALRDLEKV